MKRTWKEDLNGPLWAVSRPWLRVPVVIGLCPVNILVGACAGAVCGVYLVLCDTKDMIFGNPA